MDNKRNVLIVDDVALNRETLIDILQDNYQCYEAKDGEEAIRMLEENKLRFSLVLLDLLMPGIDGYGVLKYMNSNHMLSDVPVIVVTSESKEDSILRAYSLGASDLFTRPYIPKVIKRKIDDVLYFFDQKHKDGLTGGYNRDTFIYEVENFLKSVETVSDFSIYYFDINNIKAINELFGTDSGDYVLKLFYTDLVESDLHPIMTSRVESDHYACLVDNKYNDYERTSKRMAKSLVIKENKVRMYARFGVYRIEDGKLSVARMIDKAKLAKQNVVDASVKPYEIYQSSMSKKYIGQAEALAEFEDGIENGEFKVYYQPVIEVKTGHLASAEALVRWEHPKKGLLTPGAFIPALEKNGYISRLDRYMLEYVRNRMDERIKKNLPVIPTSINLSWMDFYDESMRNCILDMIRHNDLSRDKIRFEVTETSYAAMEQNNQKLFDELRALGSRILLDDFGSGYSSFGMIENYDFDILKIDMSFISKITNNNKSRTIVRKLIEICHEIGVKVVAEGVETKEQLDFLKDYDCDYIQGYYFYKPLSAKEFEQLAEKCHLEGTISDD